MIIRTLFAVLGAALQLHEMDRGDVDAYLAGLTERQPNFCSRVTDVARQSLGTPYADSPLGEGPGAKYDDDPLMDLTRVDCVTFVEQTIALAASSSYQDAFDLLQKVRYRNGEIAFETRNHFMAADWVVDNRFCTDVTHDLKATTATASRTISKKGFFERVKTPELGQDIADRVIDLAYVPVGQAADAEKNLPSPALILFIGKIEWLFTLHCGLYLRDQDGTGLLYHASSKHGAVTTTGLASYLDGSQRYLGFAAYAIQDPTRTRPAQ